MNDILSQLRSANADDGGKSSSSCAIQELYSKIVFGEGVQEDNNNDNRDELCFDFFMEDGICTLAKAIQSDTAGVSFERISQCFDVLFRVSGDHSCHWQEFWAAFGKLDGMILFLDNHSTKKLLFVKALDFCSQLSQFHLLRAQAIDALRWIQLWDLLLEGVETFFEEDARIFCTFVHLLDGQRDEWIPLEMYGRIALLLTRGLESEQGNDINNTNTTPPGRRRILERFIVNQRSRARDLIPVDGREKVRITNTYMFIPCSAAA
jgi:hypothetical protein